MAAFEKVFSGIPQMDEALDYIRLGDNVVWQVSDLEAFSEFMKPYVRQAIADGRNLIYVRFAGHAPLLEEQPGLRIVPIALSHRFETFTMEIHRLIEREGRDAFYVFDCLSQLQTAWATDLMMGNFFRLTCPFLFQLDTVAFFPVIRGKHSFEAIAKIRDTTQLFLDVYREQEQYYVRPLKVWNRYSETMFMPHRYEPRTGVFSPLMDGVSVSRFYQAVNRQKLLGQDQNMDSWDRFFAAAQQMYLQGADIREQCGRMCDIMMSRDGEMRRMIKAHFTPEDYFEVKSRMIGTGLIGGKACGMLLARKIIENRRPDLFARMEPHDSFYIGSDVFYAYIVDNNFWDLRIRQRTEEGYFAYADEFAQKIMEGSFSGNEKESFRRLLDYYGTNPIIVRSSSILEDGFGNAFAGKYESVFCANTGTPEERLADFEQACKIVYASTMSQSALDYRMRRGLEKRDEQMALLVQRVSGSFYEELFMPCAAGVGYSYSPYKFMEAMEQKAGMLRMVAGLGTGAVDRTQGSYPRLVCMDKPRLTTSRTSGEKHRYSQRRVDAVNTKTKQVEHLPFEQVAEKLPAYLSRLLLEHDTDTERMFRERGQHRKCLFLSCEGLVRNDELMGMMRDLMAVIQEEYRCPVDIEYTMNVAADGEFVVNLLQCRPLQVAHDTRKIEMPDTYDRGQTLFACRDASMGLSAVIPLDLIVFVDPVRYYHMKYNDKYRVASAIHAINWKCRGQGKKLMLLAPGRIGTSSPELGVPTAFADISEFSVLVEIAETKAGYMPELSFGSHFFQDLVEAGIIYTAIFDNEKTECFAPELLEQFENRLAEYADIETKTQAAGAADARKKDGQTAGETKDRRKEDGACELSDVIRVCDVHGAGLVFYHDIGGRRSLCMLRTFSDMPMSN